MKKRYTEELTIFAMKRQEAGTRVDETFREMDSVGGTFYNWRSKYAGLEVNAAKRLNELESQKTQGQEVIGREAP